MTDPAEDAAEALAAVELMLRGLPTDGDLHLAHPEGGWTVAQVVTHITLSSLLWVAAVHRLTADRQLTFLHREDIGHDVLGATPPTAEYAAQRIATVRAALATAVVDDVLAARFVHVPTIGSLTVYGWEQVVNDHIRDHGQQIQSILAARGVQLLDA